MHCIVGKTVLVFLSSQWLSRLEQEHMSAAKRAAHMLLIRANCNLSSEFSNGVQSGVKVEVSTLDSG